MKDKEASKMFPDVLKKATDKLSQVTQYPDILTNSRTNTRIKYMSVCQDKYSRSLIIVWQLCGPLAQSVKQRILDRRVPGLSLIHSSGVCP